jgi:orotate phosphoribosyltransferase
VLRGHFVLSSGRHSAVYIEKFRILERPDVLSEVCAQLVGLSSGLGPEVVAGPATGGMIVAFEVARQAGLPALYVEAEAGRKTLRRNAQVAPGARVLVVDDVLTTGLSVRETLDAVREAGGEPVGVAVLIDRSESGLDLGLPLFAAHRVAVESFPPDEVPGWLAAVPPTKPGTRA